MIFFRGLVVLYLALLMSFFVAHGERLEDSLYHNDTIQNRDTSNKHDKDTIQVGVTYLDGQETPWVLLPEISIHSQRFQDLAQRNAYNQLKQNVMKVLPYAIYARDRYRRLQEELALTSDQKQRKKLIKNCEKEIKDMFNKDIKNLTISQGAILIKLIDREIGKSSYELVKQLKGGLSAFSYQFIAQLFGHNLKAHYDPNRDPEVESIVKEMGY